MLQNILKSYGLQKNLAKAKPFGTGLINNTWVVNSGLKKFILQRINQNIFKNPTDIAGNIKSIGDFLSKHHPDYLFVMPQQTNLQQEMVYLPGEAKRWQSGFC